MKPFTLTACLFSVTSLDMVQSGRVSSRPPHTSLVPLEFGKPGMAVKLTRKYPELAGRYTFYRLICNTQLKDALDVTEEINMDWVWVTFDDTGCYHFGVPNDYEDAKLCFKTPDFPYHHYSALPDVKIKLSINSNDEVVDCLEFRGLNKTIPVTAI
ncbi:hypothetical protein IWQ62_002152 [Dispira parvispora]|uniref:Uncharacterized protein n=1 Tax=Dispira parvispora TaxID=1520584 RepID=A0A9W8AWB4_9FUNG|nr:hypothetical protein IWQ62_002152 [Dispira parvispora]